jgi:molybdenum cofactor cytidylyltransferase
MIAGILLCGGSGRRFGVDKLLAGEEPIVARAARSLKAGAGSVLAVIPLNRARLRRVLEAEGCAILESDRTPEGMGASLAAAIAASATAQGWIVALGDMPLVEPRTIEAIRRALERGAPMAAPYDRSGRRGHPVGFSQALRDELLELGGDVGARDVLARHSAVVERIVTDDPGIFVDIDTKEDLEELRR